MKRTGMTRKSISSTTTITTKNEKRAMRSLELSTTQKNSMQFSWKIHVLLPPHGFGEPTAKSIKSNTASPASLLVEIPALLSPDVSREQIAQLQDHEGAWLPEASNGEKHYAETVEQLQNQDNGR